MVRDVQAGRIALDRPKANESTRSLSQETPR